MRIGYIYAVGLLAVSCAYLSFSAADTLGWSTRTAAIVALVSVTVLATGAIAVGRWHRRRRARR